LTFGRSDLMFRRIIYISRSLIGADPEEIAAIVLSSIRWNAEVAVTGMLWADGKSFAQVIEGGADEIGLTMDRIRTDRRHTDIEVLLDRAIVSRQFGAWSMRRAGDDRGRPDRHVADQPCALSTIGSKRADVGTAGSRGNDPRN
jgi:hypothetical protein